MTTETTAQPLDKTMKIEMEIWCSHPLNKIYSKLSI